MAKYLLSLLLVCGAAVLFTQHSPLERSASAAKGCPWGARMDDPRFHYWRVYAPGWGFGPWHCRVVKP